LVGFYQNLYHHALNTKFSVSHRFFRMKIGRMPYRQCFLWECSQFWKFPGLSLDHGHVYSPEWGTNPIRGADTQLGDNGDVDRALGNVMPCEWRIWNVVVALSGRKWRHIHCFSPSCASAPPFALVFTPVPHYKAEGAIPFLVFQVLTTTDKPPLGLVLPSRNVWENLRRNEPCCCSLNNSSARFFVMKPWISLKWTHVNFQYKKIISVNFIWESSGQWCIQNHWIQFNSISILFWLNTHRVITEFYSTNNIPNFEAFLARIVANLIQKFKTQSSALMTLHRWEQWRDNVTMTRDVTPTGAMTSFRPVARDHWVLQCTSITMQPCDMTEKYHCWIARLTMAKILYKCSNSCLAEDEIGFNDVQPIDHQII
jgi:hypothetical protein